MKKKWKFISIFFALTGIFCMFGLRGFSAAEPAASGSSACIKCHTNFKMMDAYGASSGGGAAAMAG